MKLRYTPEALRDLQEIKLYRIETEVVSVGRIINARQDYIHILFGEVTPQ